MSFLHTLDLSRHAISPYLQLHVELSQYAAAWLGARTPCKAVSDK